MVDTAKRRKPNFGKAKYAPSGRVKHDDRGNALWEWDGNREEVHGNFEHLGLAVQESTPTRDDKIAKNPFQIDHGGRDKPHKRRDLRALSRHIVAQRQRTKNKDG